MSDSRLTILLLGTLSILMLLALILIAMMVSRLYWNLLSDQRLENERLRNHLLAPDLSTLERLDRVTENHQKRQKTTAPSEFNPQDVINTPEGEMVMINGQPVPLSNFPPELLQQGWDETGDVDFDVTPEAEYVPRPS